MKNKYVLNLFLMFFLTSCTNNSFFKEDIRKQINPDLISSIEYVDCDSNIYYSLGDINFKHEENTCYYGSPFRIKVYQVENTNLIPNGVLNIKYEDINNEINYLYKNLQLKNYYIKEKKMFDLYLKIDSTKLKLNSKINIDFKMNDRHFHTNFSFYLSNTTLKNKIVNLIKPTRVYSKFLLDFDEDYGINYYDSFLPKLESDNDNNTYIYGTFDFNKYLKIFSYKNNVISEAQIFIEENKTNYFKNVTHTLNGYKYYYKFFKLKPIYDEKSRAYSFKFDRNYYIDPYTNRMYKFKKSNYVNAEDKIYFPLDAYKQFNKAHIGIVFKVNSYKYNYEFMYDFDIKFMPQINKSDFTIYINNESLAKDNDLVEVKL